MERTPCHCEERSDEAIQGSDARRLDCFVAAPRLLAMTVAGASMIWLQAMLAAVLTAPVSTAAPEPARRTRR
jgi:hypothetical protein